MCIISFYVVTVLILERLKNGRILFDKVLHFFCLAGAFLFHEVAQSIVLCSDLDNEIGKARGEGTSHNLSLLTSSCIVYVGDLF
jgi:hypothetical protein